MEAGRSELWILDFEFWVGECCQRMPKQLLGSKLAVLVSIQNSALKISPWFQGLCFVGFVFLWAV